MLGSVYSVLMPWGLGSVVRYIIGGLISMHAKAYLTHVLQIAVTSCVLSTNRDGSEK